MPVSAIPCASQGRQAVGDQSMRLPAIRWMRDCRLAAEVCAVGFAQDAAPIATGAMWPAGASRVGCLRKPVRVAHFNLEHSIMWYRRINATRAASLAAGLIAFTGATAGDAGQPESSMSGAQREAIVAKIVALAGGHDAGQLGTNFVEALDAKVRAKGSQLGQVIQPANPVRGQLAIAAVVPPSGKSATANIPVCVEHGDSVLGTFYITPAGAVVSNTVDASSSTAGSGDLNCMPWIRARAKAILISP